MQFCKFLTVFILDRTSGSKLQRTFTKRRVKLIGKSQNTLTILSNCGKPVLLLKIDVRIRQEMVEQGPVGGKVAEDEIVAKTGVVAGGSKHPMLKERSMRLSCNQRKIGLSSERKRGRNCNCFRRKTRSWELWI